MFQALIVDDYEPLVESMLTTIDWEGLDIGCVHKAYTGKEALELLEAQSVDIVITDIRMPGISGIELIEQINRRWKHMKCIVLSGYAEFEYAKQAMKNNTLDYLLKPVDEEELTETLMRLTALIRSEREEKPERNERESKSASQHDPEIGDAMAGQAPYLIREIQRYVEERLAEDITLQSVADHVHIHPVYLSKLFKQKTGEGLVDYIYRLRMAKAEQLLISSHLRIHEIAKAVGYEYPQYFIKMFKRYYGLTPKEYRDEKSHA